ncbi:MAG: hypothetical protein H0Z29_11715 [Candidatus Marinimicrobia bacterium]|nr:hypothetical protein [Candidatus Neomarinimicrobiota bacterium]
MIVFIGYFILNIYALISTILIENGAYIIEQYKFGYENGAFYYLYSFLIIALLLINHYSKIITLEINFKNSKKTFYIYSIIYTSLLLYAISRSTSYTRFNIFFSLGPFGVKLMFILTEVYLYLYIYCVFTEKRFTVQLQYFVIYCLIQILRGSQFGGYFQAIIYLVAAMYFHSAILNREIFQDIKIAFNKYRYITTFALLFVGVIGVMIYKIYAIGGLENFFKRFVLQGHVFWGTINMARSNWLPQFNFSVFINHFFSLGSYSTNIDNGFGRLMYSISPNLSMEMIKHGARFSAGYPAILIFNFGLIFAYFIHIFSTIIYVYVHKFMINCINNYNIIIFIIAMKLINIYKDEFYFMGEYTGFTIKYLLYLLILYLFILNYKKLRNRNSKVMERSRYIYNIG